jgi:hypothetical protein
VDNPLLLGNIQIDEKQLAEAERYTAKFPVFKPAAAVITSAEKEVPYVPL